MIRAKKGEEFKITNELNCKTLFDLVTILKNHPEVYKAHVHEHNNNFADWIENSFNEKDLATVLRKTHSLPEFLQRLEGFFKDNKLVTSSEIARNQFKEINEILTSVKKTPTKLILDENKVKVKPSKTIKTNNLNDKPLKWMSVELILGLFLGMFIGLILGRILS